MEVKLTRHSDGRVWKFSRDTLYPVTNSLYYNIDTGGYAVPNCIIFRPSNVSAYEGKYSVEILGISDKNGEPETISYEVNFFNQNNYPFEDVKVSDYFFDAVSWASENEIV